MTFPAHEVAAQLEALIDKVNDIAPGPWRGVAPKRKNQPWGVFSSLTGRIVSVFRSADLANYLAACQPANILTLLTAFEASESTVARLTRELEQAREDGARLEWLMSRGARVVWHGKDSEFCSVWLPGTWDGDPERQITELHVEARTAIDAARKEPRS